MMRDGRKLVNSQSSYKNNIRKCRSTVCGEIFASYNKDVTIALVTMRLTKCLPMIMEHQYISKEHTYLTSSRHRPITL